MILGSIIPQFLLDAADAVLNFFHDIGLSWGLSIIALTFTTRALLIPLTYRSIKGMRAMQALQPRIKELQEKYKNDRQRMQQEMMNFYRENKVNPLASCIPLLAQIPVFITLFYVLRHDLRGDICPGAASGVKCPGASFGFIPDLTDNATGGVLITLIVLYVGTQLAAGAVSAMSADRSQRIMLLVLPIVFVPLILNFPAGLVVYWIATNTWTIGQQFAVKKFIPAPVLATAEEERASKPPPPPPRKRKKRR